MGSGELGGSLVASRREGGPLENKARCSPGASTELPGDWRQKTVAPRGPTGVNKKCGALGHCQISQSGSSPECQSCL